MKKLFTVLCIAMALFACSDDDNDDVFNPQASVSTRTLQFAFSGESQGLTIETNTNWSAQTDADWLTLSSKSGNGSSHIDIWAVINKENSPRIAKIVVKIPGLNDMEITVSQDKLPTTSALYILSEGTWNANQAELAFYDVNTEVFTKKYFALKNNDEKLGDTGNDLAIYGSKMYCVVSGASMDNGGYIEIIDPKTGESKKRIEMTNSKGDKDMPRKITFYKNKAYVTTYSGEVARLDTASLSIDNHTKLSGTYPEGICRYGEKLYVCNSGQGEDNKISVIDITSFKELKTITVPQNPVAIAATPTGDIYFTTATLYWSTGALSNLHLLNAHTETVTRTFDIRASRLAIGEDYVYTVDNETNWTTFESTDYNNKIDLKTNEVSEFTSQMPKTFMAYNINVSLANGDVYMLGQGQDVAIFGQDGTLKKKLKSGTGFGCTVVPVYQ